MDMMDRMGAMMGGMDILWLLILILLILGTAALAKYVFRRSSRLCAGQHL
jgi:hypothetical protein